jgi:glycosyltransferase involved in cell wall biosynthesis
MPALSVIVTSYNIENYLDQCLGTIVGQTLRDIEIIVVDDGSTDGTPEIIRRWAERDDRIVPVLLPENTIGGVASAANAGMDRATGDYVGFADGDDVYDVRMFELLLQAAIDHDADLAMCQYELLDDTDGSVEPPADADRWSEVHGDVLDLDTATRKQVLRFVSVPWRKIYRRSLLEDNEIRFPVGDYFYEDNPFHWFTVLTADTVALVREVLCQHRVARLGQTMGTADERLFKIFQHHDTILAWLVAHGLDHEYRASLLAWAMSQMEWISSRTPPELREPLFGILRGVFAQHPPGTIQRALEEGSKGTRARALVEAVTTDDLATFTAVLDRPPASASLVDKTLHHLRTSGVKETSRITAKYAYNRLRRTAPGAVDAVRRVGRGSDTDVSNQDLLFALMVLERRLEELEQGLRTTPDARDHDERAGR